jgi:glutamate-ammonia-ligase adenylyltransferase
VTAAVASRLAEAVAGTVLAEPLALAVPEFIELRGGDAAVARLQGAKLRGLARVLATRPEVAGFLSHRPALLERIADAEPGCLAARARDLQSEATPVTSDLETALDALRILRREETCLAACLDLGGLVAFEEISEFLSVLAETIARRSLGLARSTLLDAERGPSFAVIGMGKLAGREFTYHSDLDLIFLFEGGTEAIDSASKLAQRLIAYLGTMTGAGIAYAVDTRLRPSGQQGALVTSFAAFERYQSETAQTWEHLALLRARAIAGAESEAQDVLDRVRSRVMQYTANPWEDLRDLRQRVVAERAGSSPTEVSFKTGAGGLMDADFLAGGALLEGSAASPPALPSVTAMLRAAVSGPRVDALLRDYRFLRIIEAHARWVAGRSVEKLDAEGDGLAAVAELIEPGLAPTALLDRIATTRSRVRAAYDAVVDAHTIAALAA